MNLGMFSINFSGCMINYINHTVRKVLNNTLYAIVVSGKIFNIYPSIKGRRIELI